MKHLSALNKYFWKYRLRLFTGIFFVIASNYFAVVGPEITGYLVGNIQRQLSGNTAPVKISKGYHDVVVQKIIDVVQSLTISAGSVVAVFCMIILAVALIRGLLMFFMRQTIIVMSRHVEYDQKNEIFKHYQQLDLNFFKTHNIGDLMSRITEDVSRVRMYVGPAIMYLTNLVALIVFCVVNMLRKDVSLTLMVLAPLPLLAITIYIVNIIIHKKSEQVQARLAGLTTNAQEAYSGIRVIKSFVQERSMFRFFEENSKQYKANAVSLAKVESLYFPSMSLMIGLSTLITVLMGAKMAIADPSKVGLVVEFVIYINMMTFPVSSIGWVASMIQRAAASQKRINEFLHTTPSIKENENLPFRNFNGNILFKDVSFTYPHTGITALQHFNLELKKGEKLLLLGKTGSGKSTVAQLLLRFYDVSSGQISIDGQPIQQYSLTNIRKRISYVPQDVFLFSDAVYANIAFGAETAIDRKQIESAAINASVHNEVLTLSKGYDTVIGERGVTLSGGQKQRISLARGLLKDAELIILDDSLSAVDARTEMQVLANLNEIFRDKTLIIISHRIYNSFPFDKIAFLKDGAVAEMGTHEELLKKKSLYYELYKLQSETENGTEKV